MRTPKPPKKEIKTKLKNFRVTKKTDYQLQRIAKDMDRSQTQAFERLVDMYFTMRGFV